MSKTWRDYVVPALEAVRSMGFDPKDTEFKEVSQGELNRLSGLMLPWSPPHWTRGRESLRASGEWKVRGSRALEIVWDMGDRAVAYISSAQGQATATLTVPHVYGHSHVFKHNIHQASREGDLWSFFASGAERMREYEVLYGPEEVEKWIDLALALAPQVSDAPPPEPYVDEWRPKEFPTFGGSSDVMTHRERALRRAEAQRNALAGDGEIDVLRWIINHAPVEDWARDVLTVEREVALYWARRNRTKYVHEGVATFVHAHALPQMGIPPEWVVEVSKAHAGVAYPSLSNPYWLGWQIMEYLWEQKGADVLLEKVRTWTDSAMFFEMADEEVFLHFVYEAFVRTYGEQGVAELFEDLEEEPTNLRSTFVEALSRWLREMASAILEAPPKVRVRVTPIALDELLGRTLLVERPGWRSMSIALMADEPLDATYAERVAEIFADTTGVGVKIFAPKLDRKT